MTDSVIDGPEIRTQRQQVQPPRLWGLLAEFETVDALAKAAERVAEAGYQRWEIYSPFPVHGADELSGSRPTRLAWLVLGGGLTGLCLGLVLVWWTSAVTVAGLPAALQGFPLVISGKPLFSLPANIPVIFELTILLSALTAVFGMLGLNRLPRLHHPLFASQRFRRATQDRFFIAIEALDPRFELSRTRAVLHAGGALGVEPIEE